MSGSANGAAATSLGIELGSTRIKLCLIGEDPSVVLGVGSHEWENEFVDRIWSYSLENVWSGIQAAYADLTADVERTQGTRPTSFGAIGISAMMHGYLPFDTDGEQLVPFRSWRNTTTGVAAAELTETFGVNIPLRWSIAHLHQAVLDREAHVENLHFVTTLAGYVHYKLTGEKVLGVGDASGMFPIDSQTATYDADLLGRYAALVADRAPDLDLAALLPEVLVAGTPAGTLTAEGAALLDPTGALQPGAVFCPPEGDAGTGMVATCSVAPRTGNVSAGTSIFAMIVLEEPLQHLHHEIDLVTTPDGSPVAMVHCNNGASELGAWAGLFTRFAAAAGTPLSADAVYEALFSEALAGEADAGGLLAFNNLAGEPITGLDEGRPLVVRTPDSRLNLGNFMRAQLYSAFATLSLGMRVLAAEGVSVDRMFAHGGMFRTASVAQRFLAGALDAPVVVTETASEGGAWGMAVLASYVTAKAAASTSATASSTTAAPAPSLDDYLRNSVFDEDQFSSIDPDQGDVAGFSAYLEHYRAGLAVESAAITALTYETTELTR